MSPVFSAFLARYLLRLAKMFNKEVVHDWAESLKKKDIEAGYETYKSEFNLRDNFERDDRLRDSPTLGQGGDHRGA
jgi:hypothetical protein